MANVEKIRINGVDYDVADASALHKKSTSGARSFIDENAGTETYPTAGNNLTDSLILGAEAQVRSNSTLSGNTIVGNGAYGNMSYSTILGYIAHTNGSQVTAVGYNSNANANYATAVGAASYANGVYATVFGNSARVNSGSYATALGPAAEVSGMYSIAIGYIARTYAQSSIAIGGSTSVGNNAINAVALGYSSSVSNYCNYSNAIGSNARTTASYATQIGEGTNTNYGSLQFRGWQLLDSSGKIPSERFSFQTMDTAYPMSLYNLDEEERTYEGMFYTGQTCDALKKDVIYKSAVQYSRPRAECTWVSSDSLPDTTHVIVDQEKFFLKCAEISKQRVDNDDTRNSFVGGDNSSQNFYFYYDKANEQWIIEFGSDCFEGNQTPAPVTGITLEDFGIYCPGLNLDWMDADATEEIFDIDYYAPCYCDSYDYGDSGSFYIDYMKLMNSMSDTDWGFGKVVPDIENWNYTVGSVEFDMPVIPQSYISKINDSEYDNVEVRWEWIGPDWTQYINGEYCGYDWTTAQLKSQFGITVTPGEEETVGYIDIMFRGAEQRYWTEAINKEDFATKSSISNLEATVNFIEENKTIRLRQNLDAGNLNTLTTSGIYHLTAGMSNGPASVYSNSANLDAYVIVANRSGHISQTLIVNNNHFVIDSSDYSRYMPTIFVRNKVFDNWGSWEVYLTPEASGFISGFDFTKKQTLVHDANSQVMKWEDAE